MSEHEGPTGEQAPAEDVDPGHRRRLQTRRGVLRSVGGGAAARLVVLPVSAVLGIVVTRIVIETYGEPAYAQYILLVGLAALIPFADLGLSAAIMNAVGEAANPRSDARLRGVLVSCLRVLAGCATVTIALAVVLYALGLWPALLGDGLGLRSGPAVATWCLAVFGATLLISFGQRILIALGFNVVVVLVGGLQTPIVLLVLWLMLVADADGGYVAVASYAGTAVVAAVCLVIAARKISPTLGAALRRAVRPRERGEPIFHLAWPMLVQMIALPLAMQSDRLVLSHLGTLEQLTEYSLAAQMFNPIFSVVAAGGLSLWPVFARARAAGTDTPFSPATMSLAFAGLALLAVTVMAFASGLLADLASGGRITISLPVLVAYGVLIVVQSAKYPCGMYLTDASGLRFQAWFILLLLPINLGLTVLLTPVLGTIGPLIGSIVAVTTCQLVPNLVEVRRRQRRASARGPDPADADPTGSGAG